MDSELKPELSAELKAQIDQEAGEADPKSMDYPYKKGRRYGYILGATKYASRNIELEEQNTTIALVWKALGIDKYTGRHISEHVTELKNQVDTLITNHRNNREISSDPISADHNMVSSVQNTQNLADRVKQLEARNQVLEALHEQHRMYGGYDDLLKALGELTNDIDEHKKVIRLKNIRIQELEAAISRAEQPKPEPKCPKCGKGPIIMFTSDDDICQACNTILPGGKYTSKNG